MSPGCGIVAVPFSCLPCRFAPHLGSPFSSPHAACLACRCPTSLSSRLSARRHLIAVLVSSRHLISPARCLLVSSALPHSSSHPSSRVICLLAARRPAPRPASRFDSRLVLRPVSRPVDRLARSVRSPLGDAVAVMPDRSPCRSACGHRSPRPACRLAGSGTGRGASLAIDCLPCRCCLPWMASRLRAFPRCGLPCLLVCRHLCLYCDGEIAYMICPVVII